MLSVGLSTEIKGNILLHHGFCSAMMEDYQTAQKVYQKIIDEYTGTGAAAAAEILKHYLEEFNKERDRILQESGNSLKKGEKLVFLLNHNIALKVLKEVKETNTSEKSILEYYKGICFDELGNKKDAIESFILSIQADIKSPAARYANRRIYTIASDLPDNTHIMDFSRKIGKKQNDPILLDIDKKYQELNSNDSIELPSSTNDIYLDINTIDTNVTKIMSNLISINTNPVINDSNNRKTLTRLEVNQLTESYMGYKVKVTTISNEVFSGALITSQNESYIKVDTLVGPIGIYKNNILSIVPLQKTNRK
ncbi:MAG: hypothetical protein A2355_17170 [Spirochaetes bacterium RIFOXYB1_FULL_32_8]|nr:MAG: hypothetical protein A2355_17170 [Spirochaetes bacterium RIFOXYB1_FULL_32_8]